MWSVHDTVQLIERGRPAINVVSEQFAALAGSIIRASKLPASTLVVIPGNPEYAARETLTALADRALAEIVDKLTTVDSGTAKARQQGPAS